MAVVEMSNMHDSADWPIDVWTDIGSIKVCCIITAMWVRSFVLLDIEIAVICTIVDGFRVALMQGHLAILPLKLDLKMSTYIIDILDIFHRSVVRTFRA